MPEPVPTHAVTTRAVPHGRTARRLTWPFLPPALRELIERRVGGAVESAQSRDSGFTPGFASVLTTSVGKVFVKAAHEVAQTSAATSYREEARIRSALGDVVPAPALLWHEDDFNGWVVLAFTAHDGHEPDRPWRIEDLSRSLDLAEEIVERTAGRTDRLGLARVTDDVPLLITAWRQVAVVFPERDHLAEADELAGAFGSLPDRDFCHCDLRSDNILLGSDGSAGACDWNWPALGPRWLDTVDLLASAYGDGIDVEPILASRKLTRDVDPDAIDSWLAACGGYMALAATRPARSSSPFLPQHAAWTAQAYWSWLSARRNWT